MVSHVVLMKQRADLPLADRQAFIGAFDRAIREIPTIRGLRIGQRIKHGAGYEQSAPDTDYLVVIDFDDLDGLQTYLRHPAHEQVAALFGQCLSSASVYDFEVGGIEDLLLIS